MGASIRQRWPFFAIPVLGLLIGLGGMQGLLSRQISVFQLAIILLEGLSFLAVTLLVFAPRMDRGPVRDLYWCTLLYGVATMIHGLYFPRSHAWVEWVYPVVWLTCLTMLPVFFFRMSQTFPRPRKLLDSRPRLMRVLWIAAGALLAWQVVAAFVYFASPTPGPWAWLQVPRKIAEVALVLGVGLGCLTLYRSGRRLEMAREREQTRWILWGITIGVAPYVFFRALPRLLGITPAVPPEVDRIFELAIPLSFALAIVRSKLLDIDIIIRRSLIYSILAGALAAVYLLVGVVLARWIAPHGSVWIEFLAVALPVVLYSPTRRWIAGWVDRTFFKIQYDYAQALLAFQEAVRGASSQEEITGIARGFVSEALLVDSAAVMARRGAAILAAAEPELSQDPGALLEAVESGISVRPLLAASSTTARPDLESPGFPATLAGGGFRLALALTSEDRVTGAILVGEKRSGRRFIEEDLKLLHAVGAETERALERVELVQRAFQEVLAREKAEERHRTIHADDHPQADDLFSCSVPEWKDA